MKHMNLFIFLVTGGAVGLYLFLNILYNTFWSYSFPSPKSSYSVQIQLHIISLLKRNTKSKQKIHTHPLQKRKKSKNVESILCWPTISEHVVYLWVWLIIPGIFALKKDDFSLSQELSIIDSFLIRDGILCPFPLPHVGILSGLHLCRFCAVCYSLWGHMYASLAVPGKHCFLNLLSLALTIFPASSTWISESWGEEEAHT